jgi:hypothetical protein
MTAAWLAGLYAARVAKFGPTPLALVGTYPQTYDFLALNVTNGAVLLNISLFVFNLCPAWPLDGGRILIDSLLLCKVSARAAAITAVVISSLFSVGLIVYGCIPPVNAILVLLAVFIFLSALNLAQAVRTGTLNTHPLFAYTFKNGEERPADLPPYNGSGGPAGSSLPVFGHPTPAASAAAFPAGYPVSASGNPFAAQPGAAAAVQQAAQAPPQFAQHAAYAPAVAPRT